MAVFQRILERLQGDPVAGLAALPASDLRTLLLHVFRERAAQRPLRDIVRQFREQPVCHSAAVDARVLHRLEGHALAALPEAYRALDLAPVAPLGAQHQLGATPQDNVLSGTRGVELVGDPTVLLALQLAAEGGTARLAARYRATRMQPLRTAGHTQHFSLFALATGGRSEPREAFETRALLEHLEILLDLIARVHSAGAPWDEVEVRFSDLRVNRALAAQHGIEVETTRWAEAQAALEQAGVPDAHPEPQLATLPAERFTVLGHVAERVVPALRVQFPNTRFAWDFARLRQATYYTGLAFHVRLGSPWPVADGGFVDWGQRLLGNRKHRLLTSGIGLQLLA